MTPPPADYPLQYGFAPWPTRSVIQEMLDNFVRHRWITPKTRGQEVAEEAVTVADHSIGWVVEFKNAKGDRSVIDTRESDERYIQQRTVVDLRDWLATLIDREREAAKAEGAKEEREACAKVVDGTYIGHSVASNLWTARTDPATLIRARE